MRKEYGVLVRVREADPGELPAEGPDEGGWLTLQTPGGPVRVMVQDGVVVEGDPRLRGARVEDLLAAHAQHVAGGVTRHPPGDVPPGAPAPSAEQVAPPVLGRATAGKGYKRAVEDVQEQQPVAAVPYAGPERRRPNFVDARPLYSTAERRQAEQMLGPGLGFDEYTRKNAAFNVGPPAPAPSAASPVAAPRPARAPAAPAPPPTLAGPSSPKTRLPGPA